MLAATYLCWPTSPARQHTPALRLVVITEGTRLQSLWRLLSSLCHLHADGDRVDLNVWIDIPAGPVDDAVLAQRHRLARDIRALGVNGSFTAGAVSASVWPEHKGLHGQWLDAWHASVPGGLQERTREVGVMLEDDLEVSPYAWTWLKRAHRAYGRDPRVAGFTLQRAQLCAARCPDLGGGPDGAGGGFLYPLIGTWGYAPTVRSYSRFRAWARSLPAGYNLSVDGITPTEWYNAIAKQGAPNDRIWEMNHLKYTSTHEDRYTVYVKCPHNTTLATNYQEDGLNYNGTGGVPSHAMMVELDGSMLRFSADPFVLDERARVVGGKGVKGVRNEGWRPRRIGDGL